VTVTLIAEDGVDQSAMTGAGSLDRSRAGQAHAVMTPIRLRRPPASEPPFDPAFADGPSPSHQAARPSGTRLAPDVVGCPPLVPAVTAITATTGVVPPVAASAQRYVRICLEVLNGFRPASHLRTLAGPVEFSTVVSQLNRRRNGRGHFTQTPDGLPLPANAPSDRRVVAPVAAGTGNTGTGYASATAKPSLMQPIAPNAATARFGAPAGTARRNAPGAAQPFRLLRMRLSEPHDGVAEIVAVLSYAGSSLAMALRLERRGDQWLCALVQVI
jgi:Family of unknown function (DUF6459)